MNEQDNEFESRHRGAHVLGDNPVEDEDVEAHVQPPRDTDLGEQPALKADQPSGAARRERRGTGEGLVETRPSPARAPTVQQQRNRVPALLRGTMTLPRTLES